LNEANTEEEVKEGTRHTRQQNLNFTRKTTKPQ